MNISLRLAQYILNTHYEDLDSATLEATRKSLLDALGVSLAASGLCDACKVFVNVALCSGGKAESSIIGFQAKASQAMAAFANGAMAHAVDFEDAHDNALVHPNAAAIPAALAVAEALGNISGKELIVTLATACDLVCRLGLAFKKDPIEYGWYLPPILGAFGAAAAAGRLLGLNPVQLRDAFSLVLCQATCSAELRFSPQSDVRAVRDAFAAQSGVVAASLAQQGICGFEEPFEGKAGLLRLYARDHFSLGPLTADLGRKFEGTNLSFKAWPACRGTHAFIEAALAMVAEHAIDPVKIQRIHAIISPLNLIVCEPFEIKKRPATGIEAKFSLPFTVATALLKHRVTLDDFLPQALYDPELLALAAKVTYSVDGNLGQLKATWGALALDTSNGSFYCNVKYPLGNPLNPISKGDLVEKFMTCAAKAHRPAGRKTLERVVERIWAIEKEDDAASIIACL